MKKFLIGVLFGLTALIGAKTADAQSYGLYQTCQVTTPMGQAVAGAQVYFLTQPANTNSLAPLATVFSNSTGLGGAVTQPVLTNGYGTCVAYLTPGVYFCCCCFPFV